MKTRFITSVLVCGLVCIAASWTAYAQGQKSSSARQAWDYKVILLETWDNMHDISLYEDGKKIATSATHSDDPAVRADPSLDSSLPKLKELGNEGWEIVAIHRGSKPGYAITQNFYFLKRAK